MCGIVTYFIRVIIATGCGKNEAWYLLSTNINVIFGNKGGTFFGKV